MWQHGVYIGGLLFGLGGMAVIDWRCRLALWSDWRRALKTLGPVIGLFIIWDVAGIVLGIFSDGDGRYRSGLEVGPHFPVEELFFLLLLSYCTLVIWRWFDTRGEHL